MSKNDSKYLTVEGMRFRLGSLVYDQSVAIFNMGPASNCPSDVAGLCDNSEICYAKKPEGRWPAVSRARRRQGWVWRHMSAAQMITALLWLHKRYAVEFLRFNESGDFWSQHDVDKLNNIADNSPIPIFGYTANFMLDYTHSAFNIKLSHWMDKPGTTGSAVVIQREDPTPPGFILCPKTVKMIQRCTDGCKLCFSNRPRNIAFLQH